MLARFAFVINTIYIAQL